MVVARGVVQVSAYVDNMIASLLSAGAVAALGYAQTLALLPVSLFGMSVSAVSLAEMSRSRGEDKAISTVESYQRLRARLDHGLSQITFFIFPSMVAFLALGDVVIAALYKTGKFSQSDVLYVWAALAGSALGLLSSTLGRLYASTFYALGDTRSPLRIAILRIALTTSLGYVASVKLPHYLGLDASWGIVCLTSTSSSVGWFELLMLRRKLNERIGHSGLSWRFTWRVGLASLLACCAGFGTKILSGWLFPHLAPYLVAVPTFTCFGAVYLGAAMLLGIPQAGSVMDRVVGRLLRGRTRASAAATGRTRR
jgi:putative peptidoglycan lipid II flippase